MEVLRGVLCLAGLLFLPHALLGQDPPVRALLEQRVRLTPVDAGPPVIGTLSAVEERTLRVTQPDGSVRDLDLDQIQMIELSLGRGSNVARWLAWGAGIGFLGGALAGGIMYDACPGSTDCGGPVPFVAGLGLVGAVPVGLLGALFGAASRPPERWEHVTIAPLSDWDLEVRVRLSR